MTIDAIKSTPPRTEGWLARAPFSLFATVMGLGGLALSWRRAADILGASPLIGEALMATAAAVFASVLLVHAFRIALHPSALLHDFRHPIHANFAPAFTVATVLMAAGIARYDEGVARAVWCFAASLHLLLAFLILRRWFTQTREPQEASPAWFIPVVGNILMPVVGAPLGFTLASWFLFSVGFVFWAILAPLMTYRLFFLSPLPERAAPSLFILLAPPAIGSLAMLALNDGQVSVFSHVMFGFATFVWALVLSMLNRIVRVPFAVGWWALTFPAAGYATLALSYADLVRAPALHWLALAALAFASCVVGLVSILTLRALIQGRLIPKE